MKHLSQRLKEKEYEFLYNSHNLGNNICLLGLGGSYAYGTNREGSDLDIRGIATNSARNILTGNDFEQVTDPETDTVIYSFDKMLKLLCSCNPNTIEILGLREDQYFYLSDAGRLLIENRRIFLSKKAIQSFGGYAQSQLRRLENKAARDADQKRREEHILHSIESAQSSFYGRYERYPDAALKLYIDKSSKEDFDTEIFMDISLQKYPLRDFKDMISEMNAVVNAYNKIGRRNSKAIAHDKIGKHMCHLVRLYLMCFDILENQEIITYREEDHDFLMAILNGEYLDENNQPTQEFYNILNELDKRFLYLKSNTTLPDYPDMIKINDLAETVNREVLFNS